MSNIDAGVLGTEEPDDATSADASHADLVEASLSVCSQIELFD